MHAVWDRVLGMSYDLTRFTPRAHERGEHKEQARTVKHKSTQTKIERQALKIV